MYNWLHTTRVIVLTVSSVFSLIVLGLAANWISVTEQKQNLYYSLIIDWLRRGALTSMILFELSWLGFLWVMWLATAAYAADQLGGFGQTCHFYLEPSWWTEGCSETQAITAFSFLIWIGLTGYLITLLTLCIIAANRGAGVWKSTVKEANFAPVKMDLSGAMGTPEGKLEPVGVAVQPGTYPPQPINV
ncbi:hypothetical protein NM688_g7822 [Phlebia brevispora]|uniref:Uncharacterized protein n=1 Tax=Phlebia brevispora TaxID=194682 RepID=A0ACC1S0S4_9APHY|nr:hypothetical protein NM688_g7822 [Phlebia brevispora]